MRGFGTICNVLAVLLGGGVGLFFKSGLPARFQTILMQGCAMATIFIGAAGVMAGMLTVSDGAVAVRGTLLLTLSLVLGGLLGEALDIERRIDALGESLKRRFAQNDSGGFVSGFVTTSLVVCVGAMAVVGSIQDGLTGDWSMLLAKSMLDFVIVLVFASTLGAGVLFAALPLGLYQGAVTAFAAFLEPLLTAELIGQMSYIGSALIFGVGLNLLRPGTFKVGNLLPAVFVPVAWALLQPIF